MPRHHHQHRRKDSAEECVNDDEMQGRHHPGSDRILQPSYLEKANNKKELVRRLRNTVHVLQQDNESIEIDSPDYPGLPSLAQMLVQAYLNDRDKEVRLFSLVATLEILAMYAPDCPYDDAEVLSIFHQVIAQVGNLAHTTDPHMKHYAQYHRILELLADVKIGVVLVEWGKTKATIREENLGHDLSDDEEDDPADNPIHVLAQLFHTLLHCVHKDHPQHVLELVKLSITACLDEYQTVVPIPLLDELLLCIGEGPTMWVANPAALQQPRPTPNDTSNGTTKSSKKTLKEPLQIEQTNPTYVVAASVIRSSLNRIATPLAQLLNGLLNKESHVVAESKIPTSSTTRRDSNLDGENSIHLYGIIFELHRVAPQVLTTVIGTLSNGLHNPDDDQRHAVIALLGRLFAAPSSNMATQYRACYKEWLGRHHDVSVPIRRTMVQYLCRMIAVPWSDAVEQANRALRDMLTTDPNVEVRQDCLFQIADTIYHKAGMGDPATAMTVWPPLLHAIGSRVSAKHREERRNAISGLAQIYYRQYLTKHVQPFNDGDKDSLDDDHEKRIRLVRETLRYVCHLPERTSKSSRSRRRPVVGVHHRTGTTDKQRDDDVNDEEEAYRWIPRKIFEAVCFTDALDTEMRSRVVHVVDEVLLGSELSSRNSKKLTSTARAVGLTIILDSLADDGDWFVDSSTAFKFMQQLLGQRASLQSALGRYLDARESIRKHDAGTEGALLADAKALELLQVVASLTATPSGSTSLDDILDALHGAKDKHIFRVLSTIVDPLQKAKSRARAIDELPKRTASLGDAVSKWVSNLVKRCNMGDFINSDVVSQCIMLARDCFKENDVLASSFFVAAAKVGIDAFPILGTPRKIFHVLQDLVCECRSVRSSELKQQVEESGIVTTLSSILKVVAQHREVEKSAEHVNEDFQKQLLQICTHDGTPEQARNAVYTLARLLKPEKVTVSDSKPSEDLFTPLLKTLASPSRLKIGKSHSPQIVSILSALTALADCAPHLFTSTDRGKKAIKFAMESVLLGRDIALDPGAETDEDSADDDQQSRTPTPGKGHGSVSSKKMKHLTPEGSASLLEDENLSIVCRANCAAMELLVCLVRSSRLQKDSAPSNLSAPRVLSNSDDMVQLIFNLLSQILRDRGLPPSKRDRRACKARQDRAALRQTAAIQLLRLCDQRLGLESTYVTPGVCRLLGDVFLDEEKAVREAMMAELSNLLSGTGVFGLEGSDMKPQPPPLRCVALITLCSDGDHGQENDAANGNAANVGKLVHSTSQTALGCIENLRKVCDSLYAQLRASGQDADSVFDAKYKPKLMPEYVVPFALYLLVHRRETPFEGEAPNPTLQSDDGRGNDDDNSAPLSIDNEGRHRVLRKRLRLLFEPLVRSLGESADNISFLSRMTEILETQYVPVGDGAEAHSPLVTPVGSDSSLDTKPQFSKRDSMLEDKLKTVCVAAREVLLSFVKKDINLAAYPGKILVPPFLFKKRTSSLSKNPVKGDSAPDQRTTSLYGAANKQEKAKRKSPETPSKSGRSKKATKLSPAIRRMSETRFSPKPSDLPVDGNLSIESHLPASARKVHFSPAIGIVLSTKQARLTGDDGKEVSPIVKSNSPHSLRRSPRNHESSESATYGTSPPSALRIATMQSTAPEELSMESPFQSLEPEADELHGQRNLEKINSSGDSLADDEAGAFSQDSLSSVGVQSHRLNTGRSDNDVNSSTGSSDLSSKRSVRKVSSRSRVCSKRKSDGPAPERPSGKVRVSGAASKAKDSMKYAADDDLDFHADETSAENDPPRRLNVRSSSNASKSSKAKGKGKITSSKPATRQTSSRRARN